MADAGPNRVTQDFLKGLRGKKVQVLWPILDSPYGWEGVLIRWDNYSLLLDVGNQNVLIKIAPGMEIRGVEEVENG